MKIGIFSDIHANLEALLTINEAYKKETIDKFICVGDIVGYGANPNECCDIVKKMVEFSVMGNHDAAVTSQMDYSYYYDSAKNVLDYHKSLLSEENMKWLTNRKFIEKLNINELDIQISHGSPIKPEEFNYIFTPEQARELLLCLDELPKITFIGHSHLCKVFALSPGEVVEVTANKFGLRKDAKYIISVGSVGQPRDYDNRAGFTIFDTELMVFEFKRIAYDIETAAKKILDSGLEINFAHRLFLGI